MTSRLALLATLLLFAGSLAGFALTTAAPPGEAPSHRLTADGGCPVGRLWEEA